MFLQVIIYDCFLWGITPILPFIGHPNISVIKGDVCDEKHLKEVLQHCDTVVHLAAIVGYPACAKDPELAFEVSLMIGFVIVLHSAILTYLKKET